MPIQKNQHFVPRCALKPFTLESEGLAINLFNVASSRAIRNAPVKGQCARHYLYGKDLVIENMLKDLEGRYARVLARLQAGGTISEQDEELLLLFVAIQLRRTESAVQGMRDMVTSMSNKIFERAPELKPTDSRSDTEMMHMSLRLAMSLLPYAKDLKLVIFRNKTVVDFVTCDNPAVLTNRFHLQKLKDRRFGYASSGAMISMPLSPTLSALWYDTAVYTVPNASGSSFVDVDKAEDAVAVNELQYLNASKNVYFSRWADASRIGNEIVALSERRAGARPTTQMLVRDERIQDREVYRRGTPEEEKTARETIAMTGFDHPEPSRWLSKVKYRGKPTTFYNGTAVGLVRKPEWLSPSRERS